MTCAKSAELISTAGVRRSFLDFFSQHGHAILPGSPVLPLGDASVPFVPAGMHQFRHVLVGNSPAPAPQVTNTQRCIRVGGRHCDLATVGSDGTHLTFFEMLGSWTFGASDYWKREACADALELLTGPLRIDTSRLKVTYFEGNSVLGRDNECRDAWRSLGISEKRIIPCPAADNLWEMGLSGPCGPCTEIHIDDVEIWNLVFVEHQRSTDGTLSPLNLRSVDTGMGLERLSALLSGKSSVFDTDSFQPLLDIVSTRARAAPYGGKFGDNDEARRDASYRLLVDHARMIAVALADGVVPDRQYKLRRIIRRSLIIAERHFGVTDGNDAAALIESLAIRTIEILGDAHPTLAANVPALRHLLHYEANLFSQLRRKEPAAWSSAVAEEPRLATLAEAGIPHGPLAHSWRMVAALSSKGHRTLPGAEAYSIYDTHGLGLDVIDELAKFAGMQGVDAEGYIEERNRRKYLSRLKRSLGKKNVDFGGNVSSFLEQLPKTDTAPVYHYFKSEEGKYLFPGVQSKVLALLQDGVPVREATPNSGLIGAVLSNTNMFRARGGQAADHGRIESVAGAVLNVEAPFDFGNIVVHWGELSGAPMSVGDKVEVNIDAGRRFSLMSNHTAAHLLNACLHRGLPVAIQKRAPISPTHLELALESYGKRLTATDVQKAEETARRLVQFALPVMKRSLTPWNWHAAGPVTLIPDAAYPLDSLSVIEIGTNGIESRELCGGTHVANTADIGEICVVNADKDGGAILAAVTGPQATLALKDGARLLESAQNRANEACSLAETVDGRNSATLIETYHQCQDAIRTISAADRTSYLARTKGVQLLEDAVRHIEASAHTGVRLEVAEAVKDRHFAAVYVRHSSILDNVHLPKATRPFPDKALLLVAVSRHGEVRARCCVPNELISADFNAERWLAPVVAAVGGRVKVPNGMDSKNVCILESPSTKLAAEAVQSLIDDANRFAADKFSQRASCI